MKYDAISFVPERPFRAETSGIEFDTDRYCLSLDGAITLHLKTSYLNQFLSDTAPEQRQIRKWYFYTTHLNCLYLLLDSFVLRDLQLSYFNLEEITTQNTNVVSENGMSTFPRSHIHVPQISPPQQSLPVPNSLLDLLNQAFNDLTLEFERIHVLSELAKSLAAYKSADFTTSLVLAWFLLERFIEARWTHYLETENREFEHGQKRINADRRKTLNDHRSYPVSAKLQILELAGKISFKQFFDLDILRDKRNEIVHPKRRDNSSSVTQGGSENCGLAFELLQQFIEAEFDLQIPLNKGYSFLGVFERQ